MAGRVIAGRRAAIWRCQAWQGRSPANIAAQPRATQAFGQLQVRQQAPPHPERASPIERPLLEGGLLLLPRWIAADSAQLQHPASGTQIAIGQHPYRSPLLAPDGGAVLPAERTRAVAVVAGDGQKHQHKQGQRARHRSQPGPIGRQPGGGRVAHPQGLAGERQGLQLAGLAVPPSQLQRGQGQFTAALDDIGGLIFARREVLPPLLTVV